MPCHQYTSAGPRYSIRINPSDPGELDAVAGDDARQQRPEPRGGPPPSLLGPGLLAPGAAFPDTRIPRTADQPVIAVRGPEFAIRPRDIM